MTNRPADPIVFGPEYAPVADPLSYRADPEAATDEKAATLSAYESEGRQEMREYIAHLRQDPNRYDYLG
ncbi:hypothetical protein ACPEIC_28710 [Stenotrophomonas sp. NPDC087984]